jgi:hypothetical protein
VSEETQKSDYFCFPRTFFPPKILFFIFFTPFFFLFILKK